MVILQGLTSTDVMHSCTHFMSPEKATFFPVGKLRFGHGFAHRIAHKTMFRVTNTQPQSHAHTIHTPKVKTTNAQVRIFFN